MISGLMMEKSRFGERLEKEKVRKEMREKVGSYLKEEFLNERGEKLFQPQINKRGAQDSNVEVDASEQVFVHLY